MVIAIPFGILTAAFLSEVAPKRMQMITKPVIEMLVAIPSVAIGFSGIVLLGPDISTLFGIQNGLNALPYHLYMISTQHSAIEEVRSLAYGTAVVLISLVFLLSIVAFVVSFLQNGFVSILSTNIPPQDQLRIVEAYINSIDIKE